MSDWINKVAIQSSNTTPSCWKNKQNGKWTSRLVVFFVFLSQADVQKSSSQHHTGKPSCTKNSIRRYNHLYCVRDHQCHHDNTQIYHHNITLSVLSALLVRMHLHFCLLSLLAIRQVDSWMSVGDWGRLIIWGTNVKQRGGVSVPLFLKLLICNVLLHHTIDFKCH